MGWVMYKGPILWGYDACYKEPDCMYRGPILWDGACSYMYLCAVSSEGSTSSTKDQLYGNSACTEE